MYKSLLLNKNVHIIASLLIGVLLLAFPEESLNIAGYIITFLITRRMKRFLIEYKEN